MSERIVGRNAVLELLRHGNREVERVLILQGNTHARLQQIRAIAEKRRIPCEFVPRQTLDLLEPDIPHQGVIAIASPTGYTPLETILDNAARPATLVMLDSVQDPRNLGAIIRTAEAVKADGLIIHKRHSASMTTAAYKSSSGSAEYLPVAQVTNLAQTIDTLKKSGIWVVGTDQNAQTLYTAVDLTASVCLVLGNEAEGLRRLVREKCDWLVRLPMLGHVPSLNVSVAAGVLLYEVVRQRS